MWNFRRRERVEVPKGFSLCMREEFYIVLRDDLNPTCSDLVIELARRPSPERGKVLVTRFPMRDGSSIPTAFRRTVRGGLYSRFDLESTVGGVPRTLTELKVTVAASKIGAPVVPPLGCYWKWVNGGIGYKSGYFSVYQEKALCLSEVLQAWEKARPRLAQRQTVLSQLARTLKHLHRTGIVHTDLTLRNVLLDPDQGCSFVDLDGAQEVRYVTERSVMASFSRLNRSLEKSGNGRLVPLRDRLRVLHGYLGGLRRHKQLVRRILTHAGRDLRWHRLFWSRNGRVP